MRRAIPCQGMHSQPRQRCEVRSGHWSLFRRPSVGALLLLIASVCGAPREAHATPPITRIEEDWRIEIGIPDPDGEAPQIITVVSPTSTLEGSYGVFELNHSTQPEYAAGGLQLQSWTGETLHESRNYPEASVLATPLEVITFTVVMAVEGTNLRFEIVNGHSTTWGDFGGQGYLKTLVPTDLSDLSGYNFLTSVKQSRVGFASHRVKKFSRQAVRLYSNSDLVGTVANETVVHQYTDF
jgi:hypothetical protein